MFEGAYNITADAQSGLSIFDDLNVILDVDLNVTGMNTDIEVSTGIVYWLMHTALNLLFQTHSTSLLHGGK